MRFFVERYNSQESYLSNEIKNICEKQSAKYKF